MDDFVINVRQVAQYEQQAAATADMLLLVQAGLGGPYQSISASDLVSTALTDPNNLNLSINTGVAWNNNAANLSFDGVSFTFTGGGVDVTWLTASGDLNVEGNVTVGGNLAVEGPVLSGGSQLVTTEQMGIALDETVRTFNGRSGVVQLLSEDILRGGGVLQVNPVFGGIVIVPTLWDPRVSNDQAATTAFVHDAICFELNTMWSLTGVQSFNGRFGAITLLTQDVNAAYAASTPGVWPTAPSPPLYDASSRIATTLFVDESVEDLKLWVEDQIGNVATSLFAPINSPQFTGIPTGPTANPGTSTGQLATTAFVEQAVVASTTGVASWQGRTGAVTMTLADVEAVGGAPTASPALTGAPTAPTQPLHDNSTKIATTAFVEAEIAAIDTSGGVESFNGRAGVVNLTTADVTGAGGAPLNSPGLSGTPTAPTAAANTNTTQIATTAFVTAAIAAVPASVSSFNSRTGAITLQGADVSAAGGALVNSPTFIGTPQAPTATAGTNNQQLATTAFVAAALASMGGVQTFNGRTGTVTLTTADVTGAGGAPQASPNFSGVPTAPTPAQTSSDTTVATTAYVKAAIAAINTGVTTFNSRAGAVTLQAADVSAAGGALVASPTFTGTPRAPTPVSTSNDTTIATTAFVMSQIATLGGVTSFNGRAGVVTLTTADITGAGGAAALQVMPACGRLTLLNSVSPNSTITFNPFRGNSIKINGALYTFTNLTLVNTAATINGATNQTVGNNILYFVYAYVVNPASGGTLGLDLSTTGHVTSTTAGNQGVEIKSGDDSRTLVGMVYTNSSGQFVDTPGLRYCRSWFNRPPVNLFVGSASSSLTSTTFVGISPQIFFLAFNDEMVTIAMGGNYYSSVAASMQMIIAMDGAPQGPGTQDNGAVGSSNIRTFAQVQSFAMPTGTEVLHQLNPQGAISNGTMTYTVGLNGRIS